MSFFGTYRVSFYVMLFCATLVLSIDATEDNPLAMLYPLAVAVAAFIAATTVDRNPRLGLSRNTANVLALGSIGLSILEYEYDENLFLLALAHWLVYLQLIKMFLPKTIEDDWFLFLLGLVQVVVGGVMSQSDQVGIALFGWALAALWVLGLFSLRRDAERDRAAPGTSVTPALDRKEPYPGLIDTPFVLAAMRVAGATLALGGVIFLALPRQIASGSPTRGDVLPKHLTGFDDEIQLGQLGEILENDSVVMSVELFDQEGERVAPEEELYWRGVTMASYRNGRWARQQRRVSSFAIDPRRRDPGRLKLVRQQIKLEPTDNSVLFGLRPMLEAVAPARRANPEISVFDGTLSRPETVRPSSGAFDYEVISSGDGSEFQPGEAFPDPTNLRNLRTLDEPLRSRIRAIAEPIVAGIPADDWVARGQALEAYLRDSGEFSYTLQMTEVDPNLDPVEDFLLNRRAGHCEYFASALCLLLRSLDVPCRMINGFKGGDYNELGRVLTVRQKHAHSWVEVLRPFPPRPPRTPLWVTLDPTPPGEREASVARVGGFSTNFRQFTDFVRYVWVFYIVGFNSERQNKLLYEPAQKLAEEARRGFTMMGQALREAVRWLLDFPNVQSIFSVKGLLAILVGVVTLAIFYLLGSWLVRRLLRWYGGMARERAEEASVAFYRRMAELLARCELERPPAETPREFAHRAQLFLAGAGSATGDVADVPVQVVDAFYRIRFGGLELSPELIGRLEARLDALEQSLRPARA